MGIKCCDDCSHRRMCRWLDRLRVALNEIKLSMDSEVNEEFVALLAKHCLYFKQLGGEQNKQHTVWR